LPEESKDAMQKLGIKGVFEKKNELSVPQVFFGIYKKNSRRKNSNSRKMDKTLNFELNSKFEGK